MMIIKKLQKDVKNVKDIKQIQIILIQLLPKNPTSLFRYLLIVQQYIQLKRLITKKQFKQVLMKLPQKFQATLTKLLSKRTSCSNVRRDIMRVLSKNIINRPTNISQQEWKKFRRLFYQEKKAKNRCKKDQFNKIINHQIVINFIKEHQNNKNMASQQGSKKYLNMNQKKLKFRSKTKKIISQIINYYNLSGYGNKKPEQNLVFSENSQKNDNNFLLKQSRNIHSLEGADTLLSLQKTNIQSTYSEKLQQTIHFQKQKQSIKMEAYSQEQFYSQISQRQENQQIYQWNQSNSQLFYFYHQNIIFYYNQQRLIPISDLRQVYQINQQDSSQILI